MYGVAMVIDILTGYITDYEVLSKCCHACAISKSKDMTDDQRQSLECWTCLQVPQVCEIDFSAKSSQI